MAKILVIDDELHITETVELILTEEGHTVLTAQNGEEGLRRFEEHRPDVVVTDVVMPVLNGYAVVQKIKAHGELGHTPVIMLTALNRLEDLVQGVREGADEYISKPFRAEELVVRVESMLRMRDLHQRLVEAERYRVLFEMANTVVHELGQPLNAIAFGTDALFGDVTPEDPNYELIQAIHQGSEEAKELIQKFRGMKSYKTKTYFGDIEVVDLDRASQDDTPA